MSNWSEKFLQSVSHPAIIEIAETLQPTCENFDAKLNRLKANVVLSTVIDRDDFREISWDYMIDKATECKFLKKIKQSFDVIASTQMGKDILSGVHSSTYFGVAPMEQQGLFFDRSFPTIFLNASEDIFNNNTLVLKILIHECTHAKNVIIGQRSNACILPPKLMFMQYMLNELSAYLSEYIMIAQRKDKTFMASSQTQSQVFDCLDRLCDGDYIKDFSGRVIRWSRGEILKTDRKKIAAKDLPIFAYYFKKYPALCDLAVISKLNQLYHHHVVRKVHGQKMMLTNQKIR
ncbi:MAG: hypothetical protein IKV03_03865 [Alphaproteobacteria bacterium]|nr:hypothetical protein [Alphaproteobacteria bacterium]